MGKFRFTKFIPKRPKLRPKFKQFDVKVRGRGKLKQITAAITQSPALKKATKAIFSKRMAKGVAAATVVGVAASAIHNYIQSNSGCFRRKGDRACKIQALSCCQKEEVKDLPFCANVPDHLQNACEHYDDERQEECCELCDCASVGCAPGETVACQRPTLADAVAHFAEELGEGALSIFSSVLPAAVWKVLAAILLLCVVGFVYSRFR